MRNAPVWLPLPDSRPLSHGSTRSLLASLLVQMFSSVGAPARFLVGAARAWLILSVAGDDDPLTDRSVRPGRATGSFKAGAASSRRCYVVKRVGESGPVCRIGVPEDLADRTLITSGDSTFVRWALQGWSTLDSVTNGVRVQEADGNGPTHLTRVGPLPLGVGRPGTVVVALGNLHSGGPHVLHSVAV